MTEFEELREDVLSFYLTLIAAIGSLLAPTRRRLVGERRDRLAAGRFYVVVCGEFRRGKSSLLNALVERPGIFPVDVDITTCAVAILQWDNRNSAVVYFAESIPGDPSSARPPQAIDIDRVAEFVTEQANPGNDKKVLRIEMGAPIPELKSGLVLVDTPGLGSANAAHTATTRAYLPNADAILFVASAVEPLSVPELDFLRLALDQCPIVVGALTMMDKMVNPAPVVAEAKARIADVAGVDPDELVIVPVSSFRKHDALEDQDPELLDSSGFPELEAELWGGLAVTCGAAQIHTALDDWQAALAEVRAPVDNNLAALRGEAAKAAAELRAEQDKYRKLMANSNAWRRDLQEDIDTAAQPIQRRLEDDLDAIRDEFGKALRGDSTIGNVDAIIHRASDAMVDAANDANGGLETEMARIAGKYRAITDFSITISGVTAGTAEAGLDAEAPMPTKKPQGYARFREMWLGASAGSAAGAMIGAVGGVIGIVVGSVVGFVAGLFGGKKYQQRAAEEQQRRAYIAELRENVLPKLEAGRRHITRDVANQVRNYGRALTRALEDEARAKGDSLAESIRLLDETQRRDGPGRAAKERELAAQQQELAMLATELGELRARTHRMSRGRSGKPSGS